MFDGAFKYVFLTCSRWVLTEGLCACAYGRELEVSTRARGLTKMRHGRKILCDGLLVDQLIPVVVWSAGRREPLATSNGKM
jgi:hypothetical protein